MKKSILILVTSLLMGIGFYSCTSADEKLSKEVTTLLSAYTDTKVDIKDGVVTLSGNVDDLDARGKVEDVLRSVKGVKSIVNNLEVKQQIVINADDTITSGISTALTAAGFKSIQATVKDGEVTLTGDLKRTDLIKVMQLVNATSPKKINNQLNLK